MYKLVWVQLFTRSAKKFIKNHLNLREKLVQTLLQLEQDPTQPPLRLHPLRGQLEGMHAVSLTRSFRITLTLVVTEKEITLLDIGGHDEVYR